MHTSNTLYTQMRTLKGPSRRCLSEWLVDIARNQEMKQCMTNVMTLSTCEQNQEPGPGSKNEGKGTYTNRKTLFRKQEKFEFLPAPALLTPAQQVYHQESNNNAQESNNATQFLTHM